MKIPGTTSSELGITNPSYSQVFNHKTLFVCIGVGCGVQCRRLWGPLLAFVEAILSGVTKSDIPVVRCSCVVHTVLLLRCQVCRCRLDNLFVYHARHHKWVSVGPGIHEGSSRILEPGTKCYWERLDTCFDSGPHTGRTIRLALAYRQRMVDGLHVLAVFSRTKNKECSATFMQLAVTAWKGGNLCCLGWPTLFKALCKHAKRAQSGEFHGCNQATTHRREFS